MSAETLRYGPYLQAPVDNGALSAAQAWRLHWEFTVLPNEPWSEGVMDLNRIVTLYHWQPQGMSN